MGWKTDEDTDVIKYVAIQWTPQPDMTVVELAELFGLFLANPALITQAEYDNLSEGAVRHMLRLAD